MATGLNYKIVKRKPTVDEYINLRQSVGWPVADKNVFEKALDNSLFAVCALINDEVIGMARVVGDDSFCFYIQDVIVRPAYQNLGIGSEIMRNIMNYINEKACPGAFVGLMSAKDREAFYERFGFWKRPNEYFGHGMSQYWEKKG